MKDSELKEIFLDKVKAMGWDKDCPDYKMRKMANKLHEEFDGVWLNPVSYTHLTLPTILRV